MYRGVKMMEENLVSIIMPSWNTGKYISQSIESVINQTYEKWELIIVDDNSSDNSVEVINKYLDDKRIHLYVNPTNQGAAISRNRAIKKAKGEWIAFLDSDDLWVPEKLEKQILFMNENHYSFSYHNFEKIDENNKLLGISVTGPRVVTKRKMYNYGYPGCLTFMYNAKECGLIQIKDIKKNNDYAILLQLCKKANCYLLDENLGYYRIRKKSISHDKLWKKLKSHYDLFHICDNQNVFISFYLAFQNLIFGVYKKIRFENRTH